MIHFLERTLFILAAFQPLITFFIGCAAVYVSYITYKNARLAREHTLESQLFSMKRDIRVCCAERINNHSRSLNDLEDGYYQLRLKLHPTFRNANQTVIDFSKLIETKKIDLDNAAKEVSDVISKIPNLFTIKDAEDLLLEEEQKRVESEGDVTFTKSKVQTLSEIILKSNDEFIKRT